MDRFAAALVKFSTQVSPTRHSASFQRETLVILNQFALGIGDLLQNGSSTHFTDKQRKFISKKARGRMEGYLFRLCNLYLHSPLWNLPLTPADLGEASSHSLNTGSASHRDLLSNGIGPKKTFPAVSAGPCSDLQQSHSRNHTSNDGQFWTQQLIANQIVVALLVRGVGEIIQALVC